MDLLSYSSRETRCESHLQVSLQPDQSRYQDEDFCDHLKHVPVLKHTCRDNVQINALKLSVVMLFYCADVD